MIAASCRLNDDELAAQLERYRALGRHATEVAHEPGRVVVLFSDDPPAELLERTLEVERGCCPFFEIGYEPSSRSLAIAVEDPERHLDLDVIVHALAERRTTDSLRVGELAASGPEVTSCCSSAVLDTCCEPQAKEDCCGHAAVEAPSRCGCR